MPTELILLVIGAFVAGLLLIGTLLALPRGLPRHRTAALGAEESPRGDGEAHAAPDKYALAVPDAPDGLESRRAERSYRRTVEVAWWIGIAAVLVGIGLSGSYRDTQPLIYGLGAAAVVAVVLIHVVSPEDWRLPGRAWIEALIATALVTALVVLTGRAASPFVVGFAIVTVAMALARGPRAAIGFAVLATAAYLAVLDAVPPLGSAGAEEWLRIGANIVGIWLLTGLAAAYARQERRARETFIQLSLVDPLTGLFNRAQIVASLDQEVRRTRRSDRGFCVLMIDLDGLKRVNDSLGHHRGDDVLRHLGSIVRRSIRAVDTAYRYGGDEFVVLLPETDIVGAFVVAEKIRAGIEELGPALGTVGVEPSVSIGLVSHPEDGLTVEELMLAADRAMYQAKSLGKNQISGYPRPRRTTFLPSPPDVEAPAPAAPRDEASDQAEPRAAPARESAAGLRPVPMDASDGASAPEAATDDEAPTDADPQPGGAAAMSGEEEPDPSEVRRQIATASRSFDPDHQIRRAMDAFLGPSTRPPHQN